MFCDLLGFTVAWYDLKDDLEDAVIGIILQGNLFHYQDDEDDEKQHKELEHEELLCLSTHCVVFSGPWFLCTYTTKGNIEMDSLRSKMACWYTNSPVEIESCCTPV